MSRRSGTTIILLLIVVVLFLLAFTILVATGNIILNFDGRYKTNEETSCITDTTVEETEDEKEDEGTASSLIYEPVINEYETSIMDSGKKDYKYVNENAMSHYFEQKGSSDELTFKYAFYDINKDGVDEMIVYAYNIIDVFSFNGKDVIRLFSDYANSMAEGRTKVKIYENGLIYLYGSNGADSSSVSFYNINEKGTLNTVSSYKIEGGLITDASGNATSFSTLKDLEDANIKGVKQVDMDNLTWTKVE